MRKIFIVFISLIVVIILAGCRGQEYKIALITDVGTINDKSFNQGSWEGVEKYAEENNITYKYYQPKAKTDKDYLDSIELAVKNGAEVVVTPGYYFGPAIYDAQTKYPDVTFILIDGVPNKGDNEEIKDNVYSILFAEEQSGFLAGYAAVKEGFTKLGFMGGMAVPAVVRFGYGYLQGAEYAANEMGLDNGTVTVQYKYLNSFEQSAEIQTEAASWYQAGTQVIHVAAGGAGNSVMAAAESQTDKYVIGVDVNQKDESPTVITSAMKELKNSVYQCLTSFYGETTEFKRGDTNLMDITNNGVGLPDDFSRFNNFTTDQYNAIFEALKNDENNVRTNIISDTTTTVNQLGLTKITVNYIAPDANE